jgi:hypothetical protein
MARQWYNRKVFSARSNSVKFTSARQLIDHYGGNQKFAAALHDGTTRQAVNNWYVVNKFPANAYVNITIMCDLAGISIPDSCYAMRKKRR